MKYDEVETQIQAGDLLLFQGRHAHSWAIRFFTQSVYSHVGLAVPIKVGSASVLCVLEAREAHGVRLYPLRRLINAGHSIDWYAIEAELDREAIISWALAKWGAAYASPWQFLRSFGLLTKLLADWLNIPTRVDQDRYFCSWFAAYALRRGGWNPDIDELGRPPEQTAPGDIARFSCLRRRGRLTKTNAT